MTTHIQSKTCKNVAIIKDLEQITLRESIVKKISLINQFNLMKR